MEIMYIIYLFISYNIFYSASALSNCVKNSETTVSGTHAYKFVPIGEQICSGDLIFQENFDQFDLKVWEHEITLCGGGSYEFQYYTNNRSNSFVKDGFLHIRPTLLADEFGEEFLSSGTLDINGGDPGAECTNPRHNGCYKVGTSTEYINPIKSARIRTQHSFNFKYGTVEVRAKLPAGDWLWPAIWLVARYNQYSTWPASGEIDIMESRGNKNLKSLFGENIGTQQVASTLHWGPNSEHNMYRLTHFEKNNASGYENDFHLYQMEWTSEYLEFRLDNEVIGKVEAPDDGFWYYGNLNATKMENPWRSGTKMAPFDQEFYLILNVAVGGTSGYFSDFTTNPGGKPWLTWTTTPNADFWHGKTQWSPTWDMVNGGSDFIVDYVKVYAI